MSLYQEQKPDWSVEVEDRPGFRRFEVNGVVVYQIDDESAMEKFIKIILLD
ncbi:hypothetical protein KFU94_05580 [Chloroflexi bacterium TSY]|nr:hypothetical protein [Chloroflexi bacterium TSY]